MPNCTHFRVAQPIRASVKITRLTIFTERLVNSVNCDMLHVPAHDGHDSGSMAKCAACTAVMSDISINLTDLGLYIASGETTLTYLAEQHHLLDDEEHTRMKQFRFAADRILFGAAHVLLRLALSRYAAVQPHAWCFHRSENGKPHIDPAAYPSATDLRFSLSHTRGLVCCGISIGSEVGVDAEYHRLLPDMHVMARRFFAPEEAEAIAVLALCGDKPNEGNEFVETSQSAEAPRLNDTAAFYRTWVLKEAFVKAIGRGLSINLDRFTFRMSCGTPGSIQLVRADPSLIVPVRGKWSLGLWRLGDRRHSLAIAAETNDQTILQPVLVSLGKKPMPLQTLATTDGFRLQTPIVWQL